MKTYMAGIRSHRFHQGTTPRPTFRGGDSLPGHGHLTTNRLMTRSHFNPCMENDRLTYWIHWKPCCPCVPRRTEECKNLRRHRTFRGTTWQSIGSYCHSSMSTIFFRLTLCVWCEGGSSASSRFKSGLQGGGSRNDRGCNPRSDTLGLS